MRTEPHVDRLVCVRACECACVCVRTQERERGKEGARESACVRIFEQADARTQTALIFCWLLTLRSTLSSPEKIFIKTHRTRKTSQNGIAGRRGSPGSSFRSHGSPGVVKNRPISICASAVRMSYASAVRTWASRFYFDVSTDVAMLSHMF